MRKEQREMTMIVSTVNVATLLCTGGITQRSHLDKTS